MKQHKNICVYWGAKQEVWYKAKMLNVTDFLAEVNMWLSKTQSCSAAAYEEFCVEPQEGISNVKSNTPSKQ